MKIKLSAFESFTILFHVKNQARRIGKQRHDRASRYFVAGVVLIVCFLQLSMPCFSQCVPPQLSPDCSCKEPIEYSITICHGGTNYLASVWICTQYKNESLIYNPCGLPPCNRPVDAISWVKKICIPQELKNLGLTAVYAAIVRGTNLCCNDFLGVQST